MTQTIHRADKLALVLPTLREADNLPLLIPRIQAMLEPIGVPYELLVVDDDSGDGTEELVSAWASRDSRIRLLVRRHTRGLAGAILHGWRHTDASLLGVMDADGQHPPEALPRLIEAIQAGLDLAVGSRFARGSRATRWAPVRRIVTALAIGMIRPLQFQKNAVHDPLSGFFVLRRRCIEGVDFQPHGFKLLLEILARGRVASAVEIPFTFGPRCGGRSKAGLTVGLDYLRLLATLYTLRCKARPLAQDWGGD